MMDDLGRLITEAVGATPPKRWPAEFAATLEVAVRIRWMKRAVAGLGGLALAALLVVSAYNHVGGLLIFAADLDRLRLVGRTYVAALALSMPWGSVALLGLMGALVVILGRLETRLVRARTTSIKGVSYMLKYLPHTGRGLMGVVTAGTLLVAGGAYAALGSAPDARAAQVRLEQAAMVAVASARNAVYQTQALADFEATEAADMRLLSAYVVGDDTHPTAPGPHTSPVLHGPHGEQTMTLVGTVVSGADGSLVIDGFEHRYTMVVTADTLFRVGDSSLDPATLKPGDTVAALIYYQANLLSVGTSRQAVRDQLEAVTKTAWVVTKEPLEAKFFFTATQSASGF